MFYTDKDSKTFVNLEIIGILFSFLAATLLRFSFEWSGGTIFSVLFASVNESVWEHIKILTLPYMFWTMIELSIIRVSLKGMLIAKVSGVYSVAIFVIAVNKLYTCIVGYSILIIDITIAFVALAVGFGVSYILLCKHKIKYSLFPIFVFLLVLFFVMFMAFTINPPKLDIFKDPLTESYGIYASGFDKF